MEKDYYKLAEEFLQKMVSYPTVNGHELPLAKAVADIMESYGFTTEVTDLGDDRGNAIIDFGESDNLLLFNGHLDVVPVGDDWDTDPFVLTEKNGKLYGRGSCDMKAGIACFMAAAIKAKDEGRVNNCKLRMLLVADEEIDGIGAQYYTERNAPSPRTIVVIGEPTEFKMQIAHRGVTRFRVRLEGRQCHSGTPWKGINAIEKMAEFVLRVTAFDRSRRNVKVGILPPPTMTCTVLHAGVKENVVPGNAELLIDCRTVPGDTKETLGKVIDDILHDLFDGTEVKYSVECFISLEASQTDPDSRVCKLVGEAIRRTTGEEGIISDFNACCDMPYFKRHHYDDALLCGPGSLEQAHVPNEYVAIEQLHKGVDVYSRLIDVVQEEEK